MKDYIQNQIQRDDRVPEVVEERIASTMRQLRQEQMQHSIKRSPYVYKKRKRTLLIAASMMIFSTLTYAAYHNGLSEILKRFQPMVHESFDEIKVAVEPTCEEPESKGQTFMATEVTDEGMTLSISEMAYDGTALVCKYSIEAEGVHFPYDLGAVFGAHTYTGDERIETIEGIGCVGRWTSHTTYEGYYTIYFDATKEMPIMDEPLTLAITELFEIRGDWTIETNVTLQDIYEEPQVYSINQSSYVQGLEVKIEELYRGAFSNQLTYTIYNVEKTEQMKQFEKLRFFVLDEQGRCLNYSSNSQEEWIVLGQDKSGKLIYDQNRINVKGKLELMDFEEEPKMLTIIPYMNYTYKGEETEDILVEDGRAIIHMSEDTIIHIDHIQRGEEEITFDLTYEGVVEERRFGEFFAFIDQEGNDITVRDNYSTALDWETGVFHCTYQTRHPENIKKIRVEKVFQCEMLRDESFTVSLIK